MTSATAQRQPEPLGADDYERVIALWQAAGLSSIRPHGRDSRAAFEAQLASGRQAIHGVEVEGELVGVVLATHDGRKGWINRLAVHPNHRRRGIARQLVAAAEEYLHAEGMQVIAALIEGENPESLALFEAIGYRLHDDVQYISKRDSADA